MSVKLVSISDYCKNFNISRPTAYSLIERGKLTKYDRPEGDPLLSVSERPFGEKKI